MKNNYVTATAPEVIETKNETPSIDAVWAVWLGNLGAGLGVALCTAVVAWTVGAGWQGAATLAVLAGVFGFGALMVVRFSLDEIIDAYEWQRMASDNAALSEENATLRQTIAMLEKDLDRERLQRSVQARTPLAQAFVDVMPELDPGKRRDAEDLLRRHFAGHPWSRDKMISIAQWTPSRWVDAVDVLKAAGIAATDKRQTRILFDTLALCVDRLNEVVD